MLVPPTYEELRDAALDRARDMGHDPRMVSHAGALGLYVCHKCMAIMEVWSEPPGTAGKALTQQCPK
jgi:hypothetical protein